MIQILFGRENLRLIFAARFEKKVVSSSKYEMQNLVGFFRKGLKKFGRK
jgi:hypothetical protein